MATYLAVTTQNAEMCGWTVIAAGTDRSAVERAAEERIDPEIRTRTSPRDIYRDTDLCNLRVVGATEAKRRYRVALDVAEQESEQNPHGWRWFE